MMSIASGLRDLAAAIAEAMLADRHRLRRQLRALEQAAATGKPFDRNLARLEEEVRRSKAVRESRLAARPAAQFDLALPISAHREEIAKAIHHHQVVIVCGETGSGKSTQLPKICLELGRGIEGQIGHTQPRRIAARSVAARIAEELGTPLGRAVG
jgi:ATP-dependent helicase HrpA